MYWRIKTQENALFIDEKHIKNMIFIWFFVLLRFWNQTWAEPCNLINTLFSETCTSGNMILISFNRKKMQLIVQWMFCYCTRREIYLLRQYLAVIVTILGGKLFIYTCRSRQSFLGDAKIGEHMTWRSLV